MQAVLSLTILMASCACAFALDPSLEISQYAHTSWKVRDGFTKGNILSIAQTPDGYLWLGTEFGLYRFDGVRAVPWQPPAGEHLPSDMIRSLLGAADGTLWIGTQAGPASLKDGKLTTYPRWMGRISGPFLQDQQGTVWLGLDHPGEVCALRGGNAECHADGGFGEAVFAFYEDHEHNLWVSAHKALWRWAPGPPQRYSFPAGVTNSASLAEDDNGALLLGTATGLMQLAGGRIQSAPLPGLPREVNPRPYRSTDGSLWIRTDEGLLHLYKGKVDKFSASDGLSGDRVIAIYEDREGSLWVSTFEGLDRFRATAIPRISAAQGLFSSLVFSVQAASDGSIWVGTQAGLSRLRGGRVTGYRSEGRLSGNRNPGQRQRSGATTIEMPNRGLQGGIAALGLDDEGRLWGSSAEGVFYLSGQHIVRVAGVPGQYGIGISGDGHGNMWILNGREGLFRAKADGAVEKISSLRPISSNQTYWGVFLPDRAVGALWIGSIDGGIFEFEDGQVRASYAAADGLGTGRVSHLRFGSRGSLWAATQGGLSRIKDGRITTLASKNGLPCDDVHWSMEDDDHAVWLYMACGLARVERSELDAWVGNSQHMVKTSLFDVSDGVRATAVGPGTSPSVTKSPDGKIWFTAWDGVSVIDPHNLHENKLAPPVHIEKIVADDKTYDEPGNGVRLATGVRYLTIDYTALSLVAPEKVHFRYKLEGQDKDWREVVNDREVQYSNLAPKRYRFRVLACNNSGVWNEEGAAVEFVIPPAWYQTNWFYAGCVAAFLGMVWGVYELRVRQMAAEFNVRMEERLAERTRIARDLHDTLLQSFQGLVFRFQAARNQLPGRPEKAEEVLDGALEAADKALAEGRGAIQELRKAASEENNLEQMLLVLGRELELSRDGGGAPPLRVIVEGSRRAKRTIVREEVYRIARELLRNAYKHAHAKNIEAELRYEEDAFLLVVRDDGKGIDPEVLKDRGRAGHWGLPGMYERAEGIGAKLDIWSEAGAGTEVRLTVPAAIAYEKPGKGGRSTSLGKTRIYEHRP